MTYNKFNLQLFATTKIPETLRQKAWSKDLWKAVKNNIYFAKFTGKSADSIIQVVENLKKQKGDKITIPLMMKLEGEGVIDDAILEGKEEAMQYYDFGIEVHQRRHAVRIEGQFEEQKTDINLRQNAKVGLQTWLEETIDKMTFAALTANPTADRVIYANGKANEAAITPTDVFTTDLIGKAKRIAQNSKVKIRPVKVNGTNHWIMVIDSYQARDLKNDQKWLDAQKSANIRGEDNPIFSGALGMWDNVIIHENEGVIRTATGATNAKVGHALFLGAQAGAYAIAKEPTWVEKPFDYDNQVGFSTATIFGIAKSIFNGSDFATINVMTSSKDD